MRPRVIPCLLLRNRGLVKTVKFKSPNYVGDAINTVRIYNEKEVDELVFLDITASVEQREPNYDLIHEIASESFMPFSYGGGLMREDQVIKLFSLGVEKVIFNSVCYSNPEFIKKISRKYGAQSVVCSIDVKKGWRGRYVLMSHSGRNKQSVSLNEHLKNMKEVGVGEILVTSIDNDGVMQGYDLDLIKIVSSNVEVPVIACGGAGEVGDFSFAVSAGASAVAAGSMMVYQGKNRAVLTCYPKQEELDAALM